MKVRGWLMIGGWEVAAGLPPENAFLQYHMKAGLPDAGMAKPGQWIQWEAPGSLVRVTFVCVEVPL